MSIIAKYKFDSSVYADLIPEFNTEFTSDLYTVTDEVDSENSNYIIRTIESESLPTLMRFGRVYVEGETSTDDRTDSLLEVLDINTSGLTSCSNMFRYNKNLTSINCEWDTSKVTSMYNMFTRCQSLTSLDVSNFNTSNVIVMGYMFSNCENLTSLDVSNWNTSKVTTMASMFNSCNNLTSLDLSNFDTSNVIDMADMFANTSLLTDIGMLYCDQSTVNKIASVLPTDTTQTIWVEDVDVKDLTPVEGVEFKQYAKNTEIMLTSPLLEGDKLIIKDGKLYHYHKMDMIVFDGSEDWEINGLWIGSTYRRYHLHFNTSGNYSKLVSDRFKSVAYEGIDNKYEECISVYGSGTELTIQKNNITTTDEFKQWLQANPITVVYELASPYYELISEDPLDISLISETVDITNSSNIPLNMTINNKGLATVAMKPSTTYTVAFDKDTDSEVVVNLCGNEVTTTDNIVEITTPSEIDDELIFYGDGVEVSNVRLLEGSVSGDSVPRETFEGLKNSFEDGYIPEPIFTNIEGDIVNSASLMAQPFTEIRNGKFYTLHIEVTENTLNSLLIWELTPTHGQSRLHVQPGETGIFTCVVETPGSAVANTVWQTTNVGNGTSVTTKEGSATVKNLIILEGDWTHLTEEDWNHLGKYKVEYKVTGKNKFDINKLNYTNPNVSIANNNIVISNTYTNHTYTTLRELGFKANTNYTISRKCDVTREDGETYVTGRIGLATTTTVMRVLLEWSQNSMVVMFAEDELDCGLIFYGHMSKVVTFSDVQIEESDTVTEYEPYKEYTKTFYLNSPLLEGDTIEDVNGVATHVKRYKQIVLNGDETMNANVSTNVVDIFRISVPCSDTALGYDKVIKCDGLPVSSLTTNYPDINYECIKSHPTTPSFNFFILKSRLSTVDANGFKQWLSENPTTVVYELASPQYESISTESILCDSYANGHLDVDTNVPIEKVIFKNKYYSLAYLEASTSYILQFESDNIGIANICLGNTWLNSQQISKGINKFTITSPANFTNSFGFNGIGFNASNIQVVATDRDVDFGYFKGLQSSFESELITDETDENYGKYKVECKVIGKNKATLHEEGCYYNCDNGFKKSSTTHDSYIALVEPSKTYIVSFENVDRVEISNLCFWDSSMNFIKGLTFNHGDLTFTTPYNAKFITIAVNKLAIAFQLEEGTVATEYEPYQEYTKTIYLNSPLLKGDIIEVHNGKLCHYHKMGMVVLDGSEDWVSLNDSEGIIRFYFKDQENTSNLKQKCFSDRFPYSISSVNDHEYIYKDSNLIIGIYSSKLPTIDINGFKQWLQANPTTVVYKLVNPYYEEIEPTQEDLIITSVKEGDLHIDTIVPISSKVTYNVNVQLLTDFEQSIVEQVQATQTTDLQSILDEEIDN